MNNALNLLHPYPSRNCARCLPASNRLRTSAPSPVDRRTQASFAGFRRPGAGGQPRPTLGLSDHARHSCAARSYRALVRRALSAGCRGAGPGAPCLAGERDTRSTVRLHPAVVDRNANGLVVSPNPFYQIYEGAALLAGATPHTCRASKRTASTRISTPCPRKSGSAVRSSSSARQATRPVRWYRWKHCRSWPTSTTSSSPPTSVTASCTSTRPIPGRLAQRLCCTGPQRLQALRGVS